MPSGKGFSRISQTNSPAFLDAARAANYNPSTSSKRMLLRNTVQTTGGNPELLCPEAGALSWLTTGAGLYPARPLICRTHGILLRSKEFTDRIAVSCPFNFTTIDHATINDADALNVDTITTGLAKLNAAFCLLLGDVKKAKERIALSDLADGKIRFNI